MHAITEGLERDSHDTATTSPEPPKKRHKTLAATSATEEEQRRANEEGQTDGSQPITMEKRAWRPTVSNVYLDPEIEIDTMEDLDWLFKDEGKAIIKNKRKLPPRDDIIEYDTTKHETTLQDKMQWPDCPE
jgi:hypothetical protein